MNAFTYLIQNTNKMSTLAYIILLILDLSIMILLPLESIFNNLSFGTQSTDSDGDTTALHSKFNFFILLETSGVLLELTDAINAFYLLLLLSFLIYFIKYDLRDTKVLNHGFMGFVSYLTLVSGRFLSNYFLAIQLMALKCANNDECNRHTDVVRVSTNVIGICLNFLFMYVQFFFQNMIFPQLKMPWATPSTKYRSLKRFIMLGVPFALAFIDLISSQIDFYLVLLPVLLLQTVILWIIAFQRSSFNKPVRVVTAAIESLIWVMYLFAVLIEITDNQGDFTYYIVIVITSASLTYTINSVCERYQQEIFVNANHNLKNTNLQQPIIHTIYMLLKFKIGTLEDQQLQYFYCQHLWMCQDAKCPCKQVTEEVESILPTEVQGDNSNDQSSFNQSTMVLVPKVEATKNAKDLFERNSADQRILDKVGELGSIDLDEQYEVIQSYKRNKLVLEIIFHMVKQNNQQKGTQFLEIFIKTYEYSKVYQVLYELLQMKAKCTTSDDHWTYSYLNYLMYNKTREIEEAGKREMFDIDGQLQLQKNFLIYKQLIYESTILVDKFWQTLKHEDFLMTEVMSIGKKIVEQYLDLKKVYDKVIEDNPEFREIVIMSINFYFQVLNFEIEAIQNQNFLANIDQKLKIARENLYMRKEAMRNIGIIVVSEKPTRKNKIALINRPALDLVDYAHEEMIKKDIKILMPNMIAKVHDQLVDDFLMSDKTLKDSKDRRILLKSSRGSIVPVNIRIQTSVSSEKGIFLIAYLELIKKISIGNQTTKIEDTYFLLTDEQGIILHCSQNFSEDYLKGNVYLEDSRLRLDDIFLGVNKYTEAELALGQRVQFFVDLKNFGFTFDTFNEQTRIVDARLAMKTVHLSKSTLIKEVVFSIDRSHQMLQGVRRRQRKDMESEENEQHDENNTENKDSATDGQSSLMYSMEHSSASSNSQSTTNTLLQTKQYIDFNTTPQTIVNVQRAVIVYFLILIGTILAVLAVTIISKNEFEQDRTQVEKSIYLLGDFTNLVLTFSMLMQSSYLPTNLRQYNHEEIQSKMMIYFDKVKTYSTDMLDDEYQANSPLQVYMKEKILSLTELQSDGTRTNFNTTFNLGIIQFLTKMETFIRMPETTFIKEMKDFRMQRSMYNETALRRDAWFIIQNGNHNLRNLVIKVGDLYMDEGKSNEGVFRQTVLIITMSCIGITALAALAFMPVTFALENEEKEILSHWLIVDDEVKDHVIANIQDFLHKLELDKIEQRTKRKKKQNSQHAQGVESPINSSAFQASLFDYEASVKNVVALRKDEESKISQDFQEASKQLSLMNLDLKKKSLISLHYDNRQMSNNDKSESAKSKSLVSEDQRQGSRDNKRYKNYTTYTQEKTTAVHETQDEIMAAIERKKTQSKKTNKIFFYGKLKKAAFISAFSTIIIGFYFLSYFLTSELFRESSESFDFQKTGSRRGPCLSNSFIFYLETIQQNQTQRFGEERQTTEEYIMTTCLSFENDFLSYVQQPPNQLKGVQDVLTDSNTALICGMAFKDPIEKQGCETINNGLMNNGLSSMMHSVFYYQLNKLRQFEGTSPAQRTNQFLKNLELDPDLQKYIKLILDYANIATDYVRQRMDQEIRRYLNTKVDDYVIIFSLFIVFLFACLIYTLRVIVNNLKIVVFRSKILIKIMPTDELRRLYQIKRIERAKKLRSRH